LQSYGLAPKQTWPQAEQNSQARGKTNAKLNALVATWSTNHAMQDMVHTSSTWAFLMFLRMLFT